jgi:hypothetical protein
MWSNEFIFIFTSLGIALSVGMVGFGVFALLPQHIKNKIERFHEED